MDSMLPDICGSIDGKEPSHGSAGHAGLHVSNNKSPTWRLYDEAFREKATTMGNRKWALTDSHLMYTDRAWKVLLCANCGVSSHKGVACLRKRSVCEQEGCRGGAVWYWATAIWGQAMEPGHS